MSMFVYEGVFTEALKKKANAKEVKKIQQEISQLARTNEIQVKLREFDDKINHQNDFIFNNLVSKSSLSEEMVKLMDYCSV